MRWKRRRFTRTTLFGVLMLVALGALLIPGRFTRALKGPLQLLAPMQWAVRNTAIRAEKAVTDRAQPPVPAEQYEQSEERRQALQHRLVSVESELAELQRDFAAVSGWRARGLDEGLRVVPARVLAGDAVGYRESISIDRGSTDGVHLEDWAATAWWHEGNTGVGAGDAPRFLDECLLGHVVETTPYTCRVVLLSDADVREPARVRLGRIEGDRLVVLPDDFTLYGHGQGRMIIPDVPTALRETGKLRIGDLVTSSPGQPRLPIAMVIGTIEEFRPHDTNPQLVNLIVRPQFEATDLHRVYVLSASREAP